ncbi:J domain-containing protein, partial [Bacillus pumilus]|nr:J domain-containing protein [Bacillus pumilus]
PPPPPPPPPPPFYSSADHRELHRIIIVGSVRCV